MALAMTAAHGMAALREQIMGILAHRAQSLYPSLSMADSTDIDNAKILFGPKLAYLDTFHIGILAEVKGKGDQAHTRYRATLSYLQKKVVGKDKAEQQLKAEAKTEFLAMSGPMESAESALNDLLRKMALKLDELVLRLRDEKDKHHRAVMIVPEDLNPENGGVRGA